MTRKLMTVAEVAAALGLHEKTVRKMVRSGEIAEPLTIGKRKLYDAVDIEEYVIYAKIMGRVERRQGQSSRTGTERSGLEGKNGPKSKES